MLNTARKVLSHMGEVVTVAAEFRRHEKWPRKEWYDHELSKPWAGWIAGCRWIQDGEIVVSDYTEWQATSRRFAVMVVKWPTINAIPVPHSAMTLGGEPSYPAQQWSEKWKDALREESRHWERDEKGRWL